MVTHGARFSSSKRLKVSFDSLSTLSPVAKIWQEQSRPALFVSGSI
jgi:hypothetical protein